LLYTEIALGAIPLVGGLLYFPERPRYPPNYAAEAYMKGVHENTSFISGLKDALLCVSFLLVLSADGIFIGITSGWQGVLPQILSDIMSDTEAGWIGFGNTVAGIVGGLLVGPVMDHLFRRTYVAVFILFPLSRLYPP